MRRRRRLPRILLNAATGVSLVVWVATVAPWVRSYLGPQIEFFTTVRPARSYEVGTERGGVVGFLQREGPAYRDGDPDDFWRDGGGFRCLRVTSDGMRRWNLMVPLWAPALATAALPLARGVAVAAVRSIGLPTGGRRTRDPRLPCPQRRCRPCHGYRF